RALTISVCASLCRSCVVAAEDRGLTTGIGEGDGPRPALVVTELDLLRVECPVAVHHFSGTTNSPSGPWPDFAVSALAMKDTRTAPPCSRPFSAAHSKIARKASSASVELHVAALPRRTKASSCAGSVRSWNCGNRTAAASAAASGSGLHHSMGPSLSALTSP